MQLDPQDLENQAKQELADIAGVAEVPGEVTEGVAALFSNAAIVEHSESSPPSDDEGVIQSYMEKLLNRVASGKETGKSEVPHPPASLPAPEPSGAQPASAPDAVAAAKDDEAETQASTSEDDADRPASSSTDMADKLLAMRELANRSAHEAIQSSDQRRFAALAIGELVVASICLGTSAAVIALSPELINTNSIGGFIGVAFGIVIFLRGCGKLIKYLIMRRRLLREAAESAASQADQE
jgi:hypothetical protein